MQVIMVRYSLGALKLENAMLLTLCNAHCGLAQTDKLQFTTAHPVQLWGSVHQYVHSCRKHHGLLSLLLCNMKHHLLTSHMLVVKPTPPLS
jgi:hypothetical protein